MLSIATIRTQILSVESWITEAARALLLFYNRGQGVFWRDNHEKERNDKGKSPTSTLRSFAALFHFKLFLCEEQIPDRLLQSEVTETIKEIVEKYLTDNPARPEVRRSGSN